MKLLPLVAAAALVAAGSTAIAQTSKQPGGNVPLAQGPCAAGYEKSVKNGKMAKLTAAQMKAVDTDGNGRISKSEFTSACSKKLFKAQENKS